MITILLNIRAGMINQSIVMIIDCMSVILSMLIIPKDILHAQYGSDRKPF